MLFFLQNSFFSEVRVILARISARLSAMPENARYGLMLFVLFLWSMPTFEGGRVSAPFKGQTAVAGYFNHMFYSEEELEFIDHKITRLLIDQRFNGNVLISRYGMVIYERSFGFSSFNRSEPMNLETTFQLASISKTFTAAGVLVLQQQELLHIDHKVKEYIPEFPFDNITIRHLLTHTSGLQNYMWMVERHWKKREFPNNEDVLELFLQHPRPLNFSPGQRFDYSNTGYVFLALLIERVSGQRFSSFIQEQIFSPLEMNRTFVYDLHNPTEIENRAFGYRQARGRNIRIPDDNLDGPLGDKGVFSTVYDLFKWDQALHRSELLPPQIWQEAFSHGRLNNDSLIDYGLGWRLQKYLDKLIVHHPGRWHGFRTSFKRFVDDHSVIIVLTNNNQGILPVIEGIQDILYYDEKEIWQAIHSGEVILPETEEEPQTDTGP
ncbi:MAG: class A beta-lactamase-related serine hydrolase [Bacteroidetes bacterium]|nr:MAG: class A beta-lactamase-related serine hydrolase [Bacteroidota bacterium]